MTSQPVSFHHLSLQQELHKPSAKVFVSRTLCSYRPRRPTLLPSGNQKGSSTTLLIKVAIHSQYLHQRSFTTLDLVCQATRDEPGHDAEDRLQAVGKTMNMVDLTIRFMRAPVLFGTISCFCATTAKAWLENSYLVSSPNWRLLLRGLATLSVLLATDGYIGSLNQISDLEIDRINKPYLPIATGEISVRQAWSFVVTCAVHSIATAVFLDSKALLPLVLLILALGTIYSVRPFHTKKSTIGAILTCASMRGYAFALLHCAAARATLGVQFQLSPSVVFLTAVSALFGLCIGVMKDLPDLEGDQKGDVKTLASVIGPAKASYLGFSFLFLAYGGSVTAAICLPSFFRSFVMAPAHLLLGCYAIIEAWRLAQANYNKDASTAFYTRLWTLLTVEYLIFPFI